MANCNLHLRPKRKKKKDASSQWLVTAVLMSKDHHYIYPEGRCTEPKIRETIRLISLKTVYVVKVERLRGMYSLRSKSSVFSGAFSRGITHVQFSKSTLNHLQIVSTQVNWSHFWFFITQKQEIWTQNCLTLTNTWIMSIPPSLGHTEYTCNQKFVVTNLKLYKRLSLSFRNMMLAAFLIHKGIQRKYCIPWLQLLSHHV